MRAKAVFASATLSMAAFVSSASAQSAPTVNLYVGYTAGGGYDVYGRMVGRFMSRHLPGSPTILIQNMPGAGSLRLANWLYSVAPKDGNTFGIVARGVAFDTLLGLPGTNYDATKFTWLGSAANEVSVCVAWHTSKIKTVDQIFSEEWIVGGTGGSADTDQYPKLINGVLGTKMKLVVGYPGGNDVNLAMERGEVQGRCGWSWSSVKSTTPDWIRDKKVNVLMQLSLNKHPDLPNVPLVLDLAKTPLQKGIFQLVFARQVLGRPFLAPPGIPPERAAILRKAFMDTMQDKEFLAETERAKLEITPVSGEEVQKLVADAYAMPPEVIKKTAELLKD
ncbi:MULTISPECIES: tripartite tricarboxylate transporter substrate-binding protein [unclassified Beijerinckia]|uniref:Bug family tripartite tricarboxylate transporter substrate binding protein n=1 Tax=unclassified Beijerinckia TaxID=2638183 RepID=UPI00089D008F|nr:MULTISPECIES: tripartite tricarboxylate transporter substrate-binding protein [unclassified Beijerinckia]MDH7799679.1 tripartite-type tricarboxylate transporter receptor subunit TctC [Beijerinckia sp. GAS462]SEB49271.1 Tripartite-type tricarboxylate transporter, receptor component TctC [Beijerinckia sp. 28-YEA-48]